jgi:hypothetical protein
MRELIVIGLATWRLTSLIVNEDGPFELLSKLRHALGVRYDEHSEVYGTNVIANALTCVWCASLWVAVFWAVLFLSYPKISLIIALPFALSAIAIMIERLINGPS